MNKQSSTMIQMAITTLLIVTFIALMIHVLNHMLGH